MIRAPRRACAAFLLAAASCGGKHAAARGPDILLITLDTVRADHCSAYGYGRPTTPTLERLAREGVRCDPAYAPMATTGPSHASMFTGRLPRAHGVLKNGHRLPDEARTLAEALRDAGYKTAAFVSSFALDHRFGLSQGFELYDDDFRGATPSVRALVYEGSPGPETFDRRADETREKVLGWLAENGCLAARGEDDPPFFLWIHFFDPHFPYAPLPRYASMFPPAGDSPLDRQVAAYDAEIRFVDDEMRTIVEALEQAGRLDQTLLVVAGDHGEGLMQHGHLEHGLQIYEEAVRVPLVLRRPAGLPRGTVVAGPVQLVDLAPTLLAFAGVQGGIGGPESLDLGPVLRGESRLDPAREVRLQRRYYEPGQVEGEGTTVRGDKHALRSGRWKCIAAPLEHTFELFDLELDPGERTNRSGENPDVSRRLAGLLASWLSTPGAELQRPSLSEEDVRRLRSLGYTR